MKLTLSLLVLLFSISAQATGLLSLEGYKKTYAKNIEKYQTTLNATNDMNCQDAYNAIKKIEKAYQQTGKLKELLEIKEFLKDVSPKDLLGKNSKHPGIETIIKQLKNKNNLALEEFEKKIEKLNNSYKSALEKKVKSLTRENKIDDALLFQKEVEKISSLMVKNSPFDNIKITPAKVIKDPSKVSIPRNLIFWATLDEKNGNTVVDSVSGLKGTANQASKQVGVAGAIGNALEFNGSNKVSFGNYIPVTGNKARTISAWIYPHSTSGQKIITLYGTQQGKGTWFKFHLYQGKLRLGISFHYIDSTSKIRLNTWTHVAVTVPNGTKYIKGNAKLYINGVQEKIVTEPSTINLNTGTKIGLIIGHQPKKKFGFDGLIDDVKIFDRDLSATEIKNLFRQKK